MKSVHVCCFFTVLIFAIQNVKATRHQGYRLVDSLLESLEGEEWRGDEELCKNAMFSILSGVKNQSTWAVWIWDSMQLPVAVLYGSRYHMGSFEQCLKDPWSKQPMQYCLVDVKLTENTKPYEEVDPNDHIKEFVGLRTKSGDYRINFFAFGVCLPSVCPSSSVAKISNHIHQLSHIPIGNVTVDAKNCQLKDSQLDYSIGFYVFWAIIFVTTVIATTVYLLEGSITNPLFLSLVKWFSPSKNFEALTKTTQDELMSLNGLRAFSAGAAVSMHYYLQIPIFAIINPVDLGEDFDTILGEFAVQMSLMIDVFFLMSGLLLMKGLLTTRSSLVEMMLRRYLRLIAPLALTILIVSAVMPHTISGPLHPKVLRDQSEPCAKNWWITSLMINNLVRSHEINPFVIWYLSCDFQLTILGTVLFWLCRKWKRQAVVKFCVTVYLVSLIAPPVMTYWLQLRPIVIYDIDEAPVNTLNKVFQMSYIKPYCRASVFLIGQALGYMMHVFKPKDYRNTISKARSILGGTLGFLIMFAVMIIGGELNRGKYDALQASVYTAFERSFFAIGASLLIVVTEYGNFPVIGDFLSSKVFVPLSRLSYGLSLYHCIIIWQNLYSARVPHAFDFFHLFVNGFGYIVVTFLISYLLWFLVEAPVMNIVNSLFKNRTIKNPETKTNAGETSDSKKKL